MIYPVDIAVSTIPATIAKRFFLQKPSLQEDSCFSIIVSRQQILRRSQFELIHFTLSLQFVIANINTGYCHDLKIDETAKETARLRVDLYTFRISGRQKPTRH